MPLGVTRSLNTITINSLASSKESLLKFHRSEHLARIFLQILGEIYLHISIINV